jgi:cytochrome c oxidase subunit 2
VQKWWSVLFGGVLLVILVFTLSSYYVPGWWLPEGVSTFSPDVDWLFYLIFAITGVTFVLVSAVLVYSLWRYAERPGGRGNYVHGNHKLEYTWTFATAVILLFIAFAQIQAWEKIKYQTRMPEPDLVLGVSARQFEWRIRYAADLKQNDEILGWTKSDPRAATDWGSGKAPHIDDVHRVNEVHVWKDAQVRVYLTTRDVIHSFFLPQLRLKQDALPGKTIPVWFKCTESNGKWQDHKWVGQEGKDWELACAELCGWGHSRMQGRLYVHESKEDYLAWLADARKEQSRRGEP